MTPERADGTPSGRSLTRANTRNTTQHEAALCAIDPTLRALQSRARSTPDARRSELTADRGSRAGGGHTSRKRRSAISEATAAMPTPAPSIQRADRERPPRHR